MDRTRSRTAGGGCGGDSFAEISQSQSAPGGERRVSEVDRIIHEPARLLIVALLSGAKEADFLFLQRETKLTKGNLSSHLMKLEEASYIEVEKTFRGKIPLTLVRLSAKGRMAFQDYRKTMNGLLR
jgi:DNA-binding transcriptional ArsR family regulator